MASEVLEEVGVSLALCLVEGDWFSVVVEDLCLVVWD